MRWRRRCGAACAVAAALAYTQACGADSSDTTPGDAGGADVARVPETSDDGATDTGVDAGSDGSALSPLDLDQRGALALWLEASSANLVTADGGVGTWKDKSKNRNDATTSGANEPSLQSAALNGHDAVHFNGIMCQLTIADATSLQFGTQQVYIAVVTRASSIRSFWFWKATADSGTPFVAGLQLFVSNGGSTEAGAQILAPVGWVDNASGDSIQWRTPELNDGNFHIVGFRRTSATAIEIAVDELAARSQTVAPVDVSAIGLPAGIGAAPLNQDQFGPPVDFSIAEEIVVHDASGVVADADVASVRGYLKQKYGL